MRKRFGVVRKSAGAVALALFVVAQPQMLCALHCMVFDHMGDMGDAAVAHATRHTAPAESTSVAFTAHEHRPVAALCGQGMNVITAPTVPVAGVGLATVSAVEMPVFGARPSVSASAVAATVIVAYTPRVEPPPPRA